MNKSFLIAVVAAAFSSASVWAADYVDTARVVSSKPVYERISEPKQECWTETVSSTGTVTKSVPVEEHSIGGAIVGGVIGGVVGSQVGQGTGNTVATGAGAIAGAIIGDRVANQNAQRNAQKTTEQVPQTREERHCRQVESFREVIRGYDVTYRYNGHDINTRMPSQPGDTVRVSITVQGGDAGVDARDVSGDVRGNEGWARDRRDRRRGDEERRGED